jgi:Amt family ammonium transporter
MAPHSLVMTMIGASLLWVGWFGFNAGSNLEANGVTAVAFVNTMVATCAAAVAWALIEQVHHGKASMLGAVTGAVAGLVAITPGLRLRRADDLDPAGLRRLADLLLLRHQGEEHVRI